MQAAKGGSQSVPETEKQTLTSEAIWNCLSNKAESAISSWSSRNKFWSSMASMSASLVL